MSHPDIRDTLYLSLYILKELEKPGAALYELSSPFSPADEDSDNDNEED